jgi:hypothetical protein
MEVMSKYFIFVCAGMLLLISIQEVVVYRVIYLFLFLLFIITFQVKKALENRFAFVTGFDQ